MLIIFSVFNKLLLTETRFKSKSECISVCGGALSRQVTSGADWRGAAWAWAGGWRVEL